jgi:hypothetical protein
VKFATFATWTELVEFAKAGSGALYYHAPLDASPRMVAVYRYYANGKLRINPYSGDASHFTADAGHLDRFRKRV